MRHVGVDDLHALFAANGGVVAKQQLLTVLSPKAVEVQVRAGRLIRVRRGVYALQTPDRAQRLAALDVACGKEIVMCMHTAAEAYGFATEPDERLHILDPGVRVRPMRELMVHQRIGAPLQRVDGRLATAPAWTAVEVARTLRRPRVLATLDAALRSGSCSRAELDAALREQSGRRGVVKVRELLAHADGRAESPMESEMRLVFMDWGLPTPELQHEIVDRHGQLWRVDFAWPGYRVAAEYDSVDWHANPEAFKHDRMKTARLQECGWVSIPAVIEDVRRYPAELCARIRHHLDTALLAG
ncbi:hypothetical protein OS122_21345 [Mycolicibacterium mucogenicum]|uniref:hypothetical protein n=1 Tax=Mycolicibacterium mucogenicum TaxID=56689 RepID=UPI00226A86F4|nr:hypothetical protein [Mycolicibacterium mucogenicum]MCX8563447.1 hypothetical protein [Mycolicibacterium mucogenicum]